MKNSQNNKQVFVFYMKVTEYCRQYLCRGVGSVSMVRLLHNNPYLLIMFRSIVLVLSDVLLLLFSFLNLQDVFLNVRHLII
jgi:hypothetical protein